MIEKRQYFELINLLNKSNKTKNEVTDFEFFIENNRLYFGQKNRQRLIIANRVSGALWREACIIEQSELEEFIVLLLNKKIQNVDSINNLIKSSLFKSDSK